MIPPIFILLRFGWVLVPLPFILLWPLLAVLGVFFGIVATVALLLAGGPPTAIGRLWIESWRLACAMRGIRIDIEQPDFNLQILII